MSTVSSGYTLCSALERWGGAGGGIFLDKKSIPLTCVCTHAPSICSWVFHQTKSISHVDPSASQGRGANGDTVQGASDHAVGLRVDSFADPVSTVQSALGLLQLAALVRPLPCLCYPFGNPVTGLQSICSEQILERSLVQAESPQLN